MGKNKKLLDGTLIIIYNILALFALINPISSDIGKSEVSTMINMGIFYYIGIYLLIIEFMQMKKYKIEYFTIFNIFDLCSIMLGSIIVYTLAIVKPFDETNSIKGEGIVISMTVTTLLLWIEIKILTSGYNLILSMLAMFINRFVLFAYPSLLELDTPASIFTLNNGTTNFTLIGESPDNPFESIWDAILSAYYWNAINLSPYH
ncbi:unnamed protein product [Rhizophagus irregularis]|uniref:Uncharacterized protein n=1 Tax=Rhizophagus irregularis TaxID=588596 RepID=A0A2I1HN68_9GLOM|nr:hypothetical protein RhiirA4_483897 [Rhizophagus irregularis]CAB4410017.1 unnamed protein product [Rhizophagus irregularis]